METNNKLIAEFIGLNKQKMFFNLKSGNYVKKETDDCDIEAVDVYLKNNNPITNFYYHSDWNWLMQVVEKIESLGFRTLSENECFMVTKSKLNPFDIRSKDDYSTIFSDNYEINHYGGSKKENVYNACVEFIKWYNENKN